MTLGSKNKSIKSNSFKPTNNHQQIPAHFWFADLIDLIQSIQPISFLWKTKPTYISFQLCTKPNSLNLHAIWISSFGPMTTVGSLLYKHKMSLNRFLVLSWWFEPRIIRSKYETDPVHIKTSSVHGLSAKESPIPSQTRYHSVLSSHIRTHAIKSPEVLSYTKNPAQKSILCRLCHHKFRFFRWQSSCYSPHPFTHTQPLTYTRFCKIFDSVLERGWVGIWRVDFIRWWSIGELKGL